MADPYELLAGTANMLRGMTMDPAIPEHAKAAMRAKVDEIEKAVDDDYEDEGDG